MATGWSMRRKVLVGAGALVFMLAVGAGLLLPEPEGSSEGGSGGRGGLPFSSPLGDANERAQDRAAQSNVRNAVAAANVFYTDTLDYTRISQALLSQMEPSLRYEAGGSSPRSNSSPRQIDYLVVSPIRIVLGVESETGACFYAQDNKDMTGVNRGTTFMGPARCVELARLAVDNSGWGDEF